MVPVSIMWGFIFDTSGIINTALKEWKVISMPLGFLSDKNTAMICLMFITIWQGLGYYMMMYLAGLQGIPQELCEAATIDGAGPVKTFFHITLPLLRPTILLTTIMSINGTLQLFDESVNLTGGGPANSTLTMSHYIFKTSFEYNSQFGYAAAMSYVIFILVAILSFIQMKVGDKR